MNKHNQMQSVKNYELKVKRVQLPEPYGQIVRVPGDVVRLARMLIGDSAQEKFCVFHLDVKNKVIGFSEAAVGGIDSCPVDMRSVFRTAIVLGASGIVIAHCHPSGDAALSPDDVNLTQRVKEAAKLLGIILLDHVVVTDVGGVSMQELGHVF